MKLYSSKKEKLESVELRPFKTEKEIQDLVESNSEEFFNLEFIDTEVTVGKYRLDSLCFDNESNSFVIVEYKKGSSYSVIDQGYTYLQLLLNNKSDFLLILSQHLDKVLKQNDVDWSQSRIIFISQSFNSYQKDSVNFKNLPFELYEIKRFENDTVIIDKHESSSNESIENLASSKGGSVIKEVNKEVKVYEESFHIDKLKNKKVKEYWEVLKNKLVEIEGIGTKITNQYIKFEFNGKGLAYCHFRSEKIIADINRGNIKPDGTTSKNFFNFDDPKNVAEEVDWEWKSGVKGNIYKIELDKDSDLDYFFFLINQKIKNLTK
tara:strand:- start:55 stop:1017 length:963 start_codon:yes stop_codon:yes gene_type:complete